MILSRYAELMLAYAKFVKTWKDRILYGTCGSGARSLRWSGDSPVIEGTVGELPHGVEDDIYSTSHLCFGTLQP